MRKPYFSYTKNQAENAVDIHIYGMIGYDESYWDEGTNNTAYSLVALIKRLDKDYSRINVHINSPGGYIDDGLAIYNTLVAAKADIHTYNSGFVGSMASILMLAGTTHFPSTSIYHLHRASSVVRGNINDLQQEITMLETYESVLQTAISNKTGLSRDQIIANWFDGADYFMTAESAQEYGFVDFLENETTIEPPANFADMQNMKYEAVAALYNEQPEYEKDNFLNKLKSFFTTEKNIPNNSHKNSNMKTLKSGVTALIAFLAISEFKLNDENNVELSIDEAINLNSQFEKLQTKANKQELEIQAYADEKAEMQKTIDALNLKAKGTAVNDDPAPRATDVTDNADNSKYAEITDDISDKLKNYNKKNL